MGRKLGLGLIGCGEIAVQTSKSILKAESARVVHCMDTVPELARDMASAHNARHSASVKELLADSEVEAVIISTPHYLHEPLTVEAAEAGKHVLVEKPIACTLKQADNMITAAERAGVRLSVLYPRRFSPEIVRAKQFIDSGVLGKIFGIKVHALSMKPAHYWQQGYSGRVKTDWRTSLARSGGGYLIMNLIHSLDCLIYLLDLRPSRIYAEYGTFLTPVEVEDYISGVMRLADGAILSLDGSSIVRGNESLGDRIYGEQGQLAIGHGAARVFLQAPYQDIKAGEWVKISPDTNTGEFSRTAYVETFAKAVLSGKEVPVPGREGRRSLEIARGAYLAMQRGAPVQFPVQE